LAASGTIPLQPWRSRQSSHPPFKKGNCSKRRRRRRKMWGWFIIGGLVEQE